MTKSQRIVVLKNTLTFDNCPNPELSKAKFEWIEIIH